MSDAHDESQTYFHSMQGDRFRRGYKKIFGDDFVLRKLPTREACRDKADAGKAMTALEVFIYNYEPAAEDKRRFRAMLSNVIAESALT